MLTNGSEDDHAEAASAYEFTHNGADHGQPGGDPHPGKQIWECRRQLQFPERESAPGAVNLQKIRHAGSTESSPVSVLAMTGNTETMKAAATTERRP